MSDPIALRVYNDLPLALRNNPGNPRRAEAYSLLIQQAGVLTPDPIRQHIRNQAQAHLPDLTYYNSMGSPILEGLENAQKFIAYIHANQDVLHRVTWQNMTGREQYEWYEAWLASGGENAWVRDAAQTDGLCGTDLTRIPDQPGLQAAVLRSPSITRRQRPNAHVVDQGAWDTTLDTVSRALNYN